jgi:acetyl-CoA carboxylase/biotin carboxylase 1
VSSGVLRCDAVIQSIVCNIARLRDGGRLIRFRDRSHVAYTMAEPSGMRLVLDGITCMFTSEYDPTQLTASMSGKLARYARRRGARSLSCREMCRDAM